MRVPSRQDDFEDGIFFADYVGGGEKQSLFGNQNAGSAAVVYLNAHQRREHFGEHGLKLVLNSLQIFHGLGRGTQDSG